MHQRSPLPRQKERWVLCLTAVAEMVDRLPALYHVVETGDDDVRIELVMQAGAWEVLELRSAGGEQVEVSISPQLDSPPSLPFPPWLIKTGEALAADLQWASSRSCAEQGPEVLGALVRFRGSMLRGAVF